MKTLIIIVVIFGLLAAGCRPTLNVTETNREQIEEKLIDYEQDEGVGAEITLSLKNEEEIEGELLSVRDSTITVCTEYSATEEQLASLKYPINTVRIDEILEFKIEGNENEYIWIGVIGIVVGLGLGVLVAENYESESSSGSGLDEMVESGEKLCVGTGVFLLVSGISGLILRLLSTEDVILTEIPPGYKFLPLKFLARYPDEEPEYLRAIK